MIHRIALVALLILAGCASETSRSRAGVSDPNVKAIDQYEFDKADSNSVKILQSDSTSSLPYFTLAYSAEHQMLFIDALSNYLSALERNSGYAPAYGGLARTYTYLGAKSEAVEAAKTYASLTKTDPNAWLFLAKALVSARRFSEVGQALQQAEATGLEVAITNLVRARAAVLQHDYASADQLYAKVPKGTSADYLLALADYFEARGQQDSAMTASRAAYEADNSHDCLVEHFFRAVRTQYTAEARQLIAEMARRDKSLALPNAAKYFYFSSIDSRRPAIDAVGTLADIRPFALSSSAYMYDARTRMNDVTNAAFSARELISYVEMRKLPAHFKAYVDLYLKTRQIILMLPNHAKFILDSIVDNQVRQEIDFQVAYGHVLYKGAYLPGYDTMYANYLAPRRDDAEFITKMATIRGLFSPILMAKADSAYQLALDADNQFEPAFQGRVRLHMGWGDWRTALAIFDQYPKFAEQYPTSAMTKAICLANLDRADEAVKLATASFPQIKGNSILLNELIRGLVLMHNFDEAKTLSALALKLDENNPDVYAVAAYVDGEMANWPEALQYADKGLNIESSNPWLLAEKARALYQTGKTAEGTTILDTLASGVGNVEGLMYFSRILAAAKTDTLRAQDLARQAAISGQLYYRAIFNLANIYLMTNRFDLARGAAQAGIKVFGDDPEGYFLLGMALYNEKNVEARGILQKAVEFGLKGDQLQQAQTALSQI